MPLLFCIITQWRGEKFKLSASDKHTSCEEKMCAKNVGFTDLWIDFQAISSYHKDAMSFIQGKPWLSVDFLTEFTMRRSRFL